MNENPHILLYEKQHQIIINGMQDSIYYYFDYDERFYQINMDFQHFHSFFEIHILLSPQAFHMVEGIPYTIRCHDIVLLRPSLLHKTEYLPGSPSKRLIINFLYSNDNYYYKSAMDILLIPFFASLPIYRFDHRKNQVLFSLLNDISNLSKHPVPAEVRNLMIHHRFIDFLYKLWELNTYNIYTPEKFDNELSEKIYGITSYIHTHYQTNLSLESLSKRFYISTYYLSHQFKKVTGYNLSHYIQMTRVRSAQYALINSRNKITDISESCGFTSFSQFNRVFHKFCGISPSDFRKNPVTSDFQQSIFLE